MDAWTRKSPHPWLAVRIYAETLEMACGEDATIDKGSVFQMMPIIKGLICEVARLVAEE